MVESAASILEVRDLDVWYGRVQVLFGLDLQVGPGEAVAMLGTNGAGKPRCCAGPLGERPRVLLGGGVVIAEGTPTRCAPTRS